MQRLSGNYCQWALFDVRSTTGAYGEQDLEK